MISHALLALISLGQIPPHPHLEGAQKSTKTPEAQIVLQDRIIPLPALPKDVDQAKSQYPALHAQIEGALQDLEKPILSLRAAMPPGTRLPTSLKLRPADAKVAKALVQILNDPVYDALENEVIAVWQRWINILVENGIARPSEPIPGEMRQAKTVTDPHLKIKLDRKESHWDRDNEDPIMHAYSPEGDLASGSGSRDPSVYSKDADAERQSFDRSVERVAKRLEVAKTLSPELSKAWIPLVARLNTCAATLADLDQQAGVPDPGLELLHRKTKMVFFERFRSALWFCEVVWSQMASQDPPPPLRELK